MADGTFAVLLLGFGLADMTANHCGSGTGCLGLIPDTPRIAASAGTILERRAEPGGEIALRYDFGRRRGPFGEAVGLSLGERGEAWVGYGATWGHAFGDLYAELHAMTGLYTPGDGLDLGGALAFRSGVELGYEAANGWRYALSYDHRSNAELYEANPGMEAVHLRVSVPLR